jgi:phosphoenolpyruvate synthase/pyruvate phosphate dikinase
MNTRLHAPRGNKKEIPIDTIVAGMHVSSGILVGLNAPLPANQVGRFALSLQRLRKHGKGIILRCRETFPYMIPVLSQVDGIISPKTTAVAKGHAAEFCREEGKSFVVADDSTWGALERHEGEKILVDSRGQKIVLAPDRRSAQKAAAGYAPLPETRLIGDLIRAGRHISLLSTIPEQIGFPGKFSYLCRQEQLLMSRGTSPWNLLRRSKEECSQILYTLWNEYVSGIRPGVEIILRSLDARSDEYPGSPLNHERNPQLGNHGPSLFSSYPHLLEAETAAIAKVKGDNSDKTITYLLPFVRTANEISLARKALTGALANESLPDDSVNLAVMFETPSLPYLMDELAAANVKTIWIGTKDLLMSFIMVDRDNPNPQLQDYLKLLNNWGEPNRPFIEYLSETTGRFIDRGFEIVVYALASEMPTYARYLPNRVGFLLSKGSVKAALSLLPD